MTAGFKWRLCHPEVDSTGGDVPCAREAPGALLPYRGRIYMFGGGTLRYGASSGQGNKSTLGALNDLWVFDPSFDAWNLLEANDGAAGFDVPAERPCARMLPAWVEIDDRFYLFGGLSILSEGWKFTLLNDLWMYEPPDGRWTLLEPDDGVLLEHPDFAGRGRPATMGGFGTAVIGSRIYLFGGWGHRAPLPPTVETAVLSRKLWTYDTRTGTWDRIEPAEGAAFPPKRYVMSMTAWEDRIYVWAGRDTQDRDPQFYNDLWCFDPATCEWTCLEQNDFGAVNRPSARYGQGSARIGDHWYVFGGFGPRGTFMPEEVNGPQLNDLWRLNLGTGDWTCLQAHDGSKDYSESAPHPGVRRVPGMAALDDSVYLFGGLDLASGPDDDGPVTGFNDLWVGRAPR
ncbi:MAG: hypothetical protein OXH06_13975 [Gemmatimonadetes bacterium]|nr:hypothetical protein [Gemmatimonadota bacterium]